MKKETKTKKELLAEIADLKTRLEEAEMKAQNANGNRIGRERAEEAMRKAEDGQRIAENGQRIAENGQRKAENGQRKAESSLKQSENQVKNLTSNLLLAEERERKRIANDLHDSLGQSLNAISTTVRNALQQVGDKVKTGCESLEAIMPVIEQSIQEVRRIGTNLRPSILDDLGLLSAIGWFKREYQTTYPSIRIEEQIEILETEVAYHLKAVIYRILQEAMNNIAKYSKASLVHLSLKKKDDRVELTIEDNGVGFDLESVKKGLGLGSMRERAEFSGGSFEIESTKGKGTIIRASWPLLADSH